MATTTTAADDRHILIHSYGIGFHNVGPFLFETLPPDFTADDSNAVVENIPGGFVQFTGSGKYERFEDWLYAERTSEEEAFINQFRIAECLRSMGRGLVEIEFDAENHWATVNGHQHQFKEDEPYL